MGARSKDRREGRRGGRRLLAWEVEEEVEGARDDGRELELAPLLPRAEQRQPPRSELNGCGGKTTAAELQRAPEEGRGRPWR